MSEDLRKFIEDLEMMLMCKKVRNEKNEEYCKALEWVENQVNYMKGEYENEDEA